MNYGSVWPSGLGVGLKILKVWGSYLTAGHVHKSQTNFSVHTASAYLTVMGTWWNMES